MRAGQEIVAPSAPAFFDWIQLTDVRVDKRGIRGVCTPANLVKFGSQQRAIRGVCMPANLMTFVSTSVGFAEYARLPT